MPALDRLVGTGAKVVEDVSPGIGRALSAGLEEIFGASNVASKLNSAGGETARVAEKLATSATDVLAHPAVGQRIYVATRLSDMSPELDRIGGTATISRVTEGISAGEKVPFVAVKEAPGTLMNWNILAEQQAKLAEIYGPQPARAIPSFSKSDGFKRF